MGDQKPPAQATSQRKGPKPLQSSNSKTQYLILYNFVSCLLWTVVLGRVLLLVPMVGFGRVYKGVGQFTKWTQTAAALEIVHALFGIVRAPVATTGMQVASRLLLVWPIVNTFPFLAKSAFYTSMLLAWSITEVIRYSYFVFTLSGYQPSFITFLRYNTFFILYPLGISSECALIYKAIAPAENRFGKEAGWVLWAILAVYVPGAYVLFTHMMAQRRKVLRVKTVAKAEKRGGERDV